MSYQTPRGTYDILPDEIYQWQELEKIIQRKTALYRYQEIRTPFFEETSVFARKNDSSDMVNKEMYSFLSNQDSYTLRPEGTAGVIRAFNQHKLYGSMELPAKFYYMGPMFRHERPQKGRQRQFTQFGVEAIGVKNPLIDVETIALGVDIIHELGIQSVKVCINTLGDDISRTAYRNALRNHFEPHLNCLCSDCRRRYEQNPLRILDCKVDQHQMALQTAPKLSEYLNEESKIYFNQVLSALEMIGIPYEVDDRLVRGLDYYTHTVFEVKSTRLDSGAQSTIFAGGRYDHLVEYFGGPELSGIGFAIGIERLLNLANDEGYQFLKQNINDVYIIGLGDVGNAPLKLVQKLRYAGIVAEANYLPRSMKAQFKSADRSCSKYIIILGEDELRNNVVNLKRTSDRTQITISQDEIIEQIKRWESE